MTQPNLTLYHFPGACSEVSLFALEQAGLSYTLELVNLSQGEQSRPDYVALHPLGKIPLLLIDGEPLIESAAILTYIAALAPKSGVLPGQEADPRTRAEAVGGMTFCAGTLHPQVRGLMNPQRITNGDVEGVREKSKELARKSFGYADKRIADRGWWLGEPSAVDVYVNWAFSVAQRGGFDPKDFPALAELPERLSGSPAFVRMLEANAAARTALGL